MNAKTKKIIQSIIIILIGIMLIVSLAFDIVYASAEGISIGFSGFDYIKLYSKLAGGETDAAAMFIEASAILNIIWGSITILLGLITLSVNNKRINNTAILLSIVFSILYMVAGFVASSETGGAMGVQDYGVSVSTLAFIGVTVIAFLIGIYACVRDDDEEEEAQVASNGFINQTQNESLPKENTGNVIKEKAKDELSTMEQYELLEKAKKLYDKGILTEEEFISEKNKILGK